MRKKIHLCSVFLAILLGFSNAFAQEMKVSPSMDSVGQSPDRMQKSGWMLSLNAGGGGGGVTRRWSFTPQVGYFVAKRLSLGVQLSYGGYRFGRSGLAYGEGYHSVAPEIFARYYILPYKVKPFVQVSTGYNWQWGATTENGRTVRNTATGAVGAVALGLNWNVSKSFAVEALYNVRLFRNPKYMDANSETRFRLGVSYFFK